MGSRDTRRRYHAPGVSMAPHAERTETTKISSERTGRLSTPVSGRNSFVANRLSHGRNRPGCKHLYCHDRGIEREPIAQRAARHGGKKAESQNARRVSLHAMRKHRKPQGSPHQRHEIPSHGRPHNAVPGLPSERTWISPEYRLNRKPDAVKAARPVWGEA